MIEYSIDEKGIFSARFSGPVSFREIKEHLEEFKALDCLPMDARLFYDLQEGEIDLAEEDLINIGRLANDTTSNYTSVRTAFLVSKPDVTAFTYLFSQFKKNKHSIRRVFSTADAAMNWLLNS